VAKRKSTRLQRTLEAILPGKFGEIYRETHDLLTMVLDLFQKEIPEATLIDSLRKDRDEPIGVYVDIPFCPTTCPYCPFMIEMDSPKSREEYVNALIWHLEGLAAKLSDNKVDWIHFGGRTPSTLTADQFQRIMDSMHGMNVNHEATVTMEIRLEHILEDPEKLANYVSAGANRFSAGVQSLGEERNRIFGRPLHEEVIISGIRLLKDSDFEFNIDLMYGAPGQTFGSLESTLKKVVELEVPQITAYLAMPFKGTHFYDKYEKLSLSEKMRLMVTQKKMTDYLLNSLLSNGYHQSHTFVFAKEGVTQQSTVKDTATFADVSMVASNQRVLGVGPSSYSLLNGTLVVNPYDREGYIKAVESGKEMDYIGMTLNGKLIRSFKEVASHISRMSQLMPSEKELSQYSLFKTFVSYVAWTQLYRWGRNWTSNSEHLGFPTGSKSPDRVVKNPKYVGRPL
jgi:oxygen-independent coproporphyrinogen-3 oxidase